MCNYISSIVSVQLGDTRHANRTEIRQNNLVNVLLRRSTKFILQQTLFYGWLFVKFSVLDRKRYQFYQ